MFLHSVSGYGGWIMKKYKQTWYYECLDCNVEIIPDKIPKLSIMRISPNCPKCGTKDSVIFTQKCVEVLKQ